ncbi:MAG: hypothetical protein A3I29_02060 [Candidatus Magasanikbacteria bacterium RIFCSPLOWO2_02_FULL_44_11]|uniref:Uncharacterized protein n=2 Tax=Candidatus Magasanikiibacteriota TaxID=1752731 RepID=A0A1F6NAC0_9BACT|nr:MAG: hypothetical protein A3D53_03420 [Candidatus Magasanikbacteria bacterium RIFCSPHIGHO2_02_FULL_45_10]OGH80829.1 MAG: hypothetical protein A3I29_02060 [Candidatus Magasanikbacteria bacterium RIFCSPLOWO2_02_FULL_44_11]
MYLFIVQRLCLEALLDILYFPVWWYSRGFIWVTQSALDWCRIGKRRLAPGLWLQNIFVPMYGQYDFTGKVISFFMRLIQIVVRSVILGLFCFGCLMVVAIWLIWPVMVIWGLTKSLFSPL